jgi:hypothetical protein
VDEGFFTPVRIPVTLGSINEPWLFPVPRTAILTEINADDALGQGFVGDDLKPFESAPFNSTSDKSCSCMHSIVLPDEAQAVPESTVPRLSVSDFVSSCHHCRCKPCGNHFIIYAAIALLDSVLEGSPRTPLRANQSYRCKLLR